MKNYYFRLYWFYKFLPVLLFRIFIYCLFLVYIFYFPDIAKTTAHKLLGVFIIFFINEAFILIKLYRTKPLQKVDDSATPNTEMLWYDARLAYEKSSTAEELISSFLKRHDIQFLLSKIDGDFKILDSTTSKDSLLTISQEVVKIVRGKYITSVDLFVAYLLLTEDSTKFLEDLELTQEDLMNILYWTRNAFRADSKVPFRIIFNGSGAFDFFVFGWTTELQKYAIDVTDEVLHAHHAPIAVGRGREYKELITTLAKSSSNNIIIVGHPGTGRSSLVRLLAYQSHLGILPHNVNHKSVYEVLTDRLLASAHTQGELEERLGVLLDEISHSGNVALFIQNIENIFGGGGFGFDMSGVLYPYLKNGKMPVIGTTTPAGYKQYLQRQENLLSIFDVINLEEPDSNAALFMIFEKVGEMEGKYRVAVSYSAVQEAISLSSSYLPDMYLPGKAITLLEDVLSAANLAHKKIVGKHDIIEAVQSKTKILLEKPTQEEEQILLNLEDEIHKRLINQEEAVKSIATALRRLRSGFVNKKRPISVFLFLGPTGVGKTETAKALAALYFGDESRMIRLDMSEYQTQDSLPRILGGMYEGSYVGHTLVDSVREQPFSLLLLDEFEKAHPRILDLFLQVFDEGRLTDNQGRTISFTNCIIIATSNAGSEEIRESIGKNESHEKLQKELIDYLMKNGIYRPELLNRFDDVIIYKPLSHAHAKEVAKLILSSELKTLEEKQIFISFADTVVDVIVEQGYNEEFGARNLRRFITNTIEDIISRLILEEKIKHGTRAELVVDSNGVFSLKY